MRQVIITSEKARGRMFEVADLGEAEGSKTSWVTEKYARALSKKGVGFGTGDMVQAIFPDTTTFYPGVVMGKIKSKCLVKFDDDEEDSLDEDDDGFGSVKEVKVQHVFVE